MAKSDVKTEGPTDVVKGAKVAMPATVSEDLDAMMREDAGMGISNRPEDNIVPQLKVLQPLSPEVMDGPDRVPGAQAGDFLLGTTLVKGKEGIWFQPCAIQHKLFEFMPLDRGGGFVAEHPMARDEQGTVMFEEGGDPVLPSRAVKVDKFRYEINDNNLIHYRQLAGFAWVYAGSKRLEEQGQPYVISFKSTGHTTMRMWMTKAARANQFADGNQRPLFAHLYRLTTSHQRNAKGQWYALEVGDPVLIAPGVVAEPAQVYRTGRALAQAFARGEKESALPETRLSEDAAPPSNRDDREIPF